jgi:hypothetical protein
VIDDVREPERTLEEEEGENDKGMNTVVSWKAKQTTGPRLFRMVYWHRTDI